MAQKISETPISVIVADVIRDSNVRVGLEQIKEMALSVQGGLLSPICVRQIGEVKKGPRKGDPEYRCVYGHRRLEAYLMNAAQCREEGKSDEKWLTIPAFVLTGEDMDEDYARLIENAGRQDLSVTEIGRAALKLRVKHNQSGAKIADKCGLSRSHVSNCLNIVEKCIPEVIKAYDSGAGLTFNDLVAYKALPVKEQKERFAIVADAAARAAASPGATPGKTAREPRDPLGPPSDKKIHAVIQFLNAQAGPLPSDLAGLLAGLKWASLGGLCPVALPDPALAEKTAKDAAAAEAKAKRDTLTRAEAEAKAEADAKIAAARAAAGVSPPKARGRKVAAPAPTN